MASLGVTPRTSSVVTRISALTWALLQQDRLLTLVPYGVVRQLVEAGQLCTLDVSPVLPFSPLGWLCHEHGLSLAAQRFTQHLQQSIPATP